RRQQRRARPSEHYTARDQTKEPPGTCDPHVGTVGQRRPLARPKWRCRLHLQVSWGFVAPVSGPKIGAIPMVVTGTYDPYLVALSILVASFASYTALDLGGHVGTTRGPARRVWLVAAAITMGGGIWSMHFVAMLAFVMPMPMSYALGLTTL